MGIGFLAMTEGNPLLVPVQTPNPTVYATFFSLVRRLLRDVLLGIHALPSSAAMIPAMVSWPCLRMVSR
jgi:hypothetical protein